MGMDLDIGHSRRQGRRLAKTEVLPEADDFSIRAHGQRAPRARADVDETASIQGAVDDVTPPAPHVSLRVSDRCARQDRQHDTQL
jgi:hypothetical protein